MQKFTTSNRPKLSPGCEQKPTYRPGSDLSLPAAKMATPTRGALSPTTPPLISRDVLSKRARGLKQRFCWLTLVLGGFQSVSAATSHPAANLPLGKMVQPSAATGTLLGKGNDPMASANGFAQMGALTRQPYSSLAAPGAQTNGGATLDAQATNDFSSHQGTGSELDIRPVLVAWEAGCASGQAAAGISSLVESSVVTTTILALVVGSGFAAATSRFRGALERIACWA